MVYKELRDKPTKRLERHLRWATAARLDQIAENGKGKIKECLPDFPFSIFHFQLCYWPLTRETINIKFGVFDAERLAFKLRSRPSGNSPPKDWQNVLRDRPDPRHYSRAIISSVVPEVDTAMRRILLQRHTARRRLLCPATRILALRSTTNHVPSRTDRLVNSFAAVESTVFRALFAAFGQRRRRSML